MEVDVGYERDARLEAGVVDRDPLDRASAVGRRQEQTLLERGRVRIGVDVVAVSATVYGGTRIGGAAAGCDEQREEEESHRGGR